MGLSKDRELKLGIRTKRKKTARGGGQKRNKIADTGVRIKMHRDAGGKMARQSHKQARSGERERPKERQKKPTGHADQYQERNEG